MDDMTAFDRQVAAEFLRDAGPSEPVDDAAIFAVIASADGPRSRFQAMFSATKLVVAGAIVALFSGLLVAGVLTQPSDERVPAAGTDSPAPTVIVPGVDLDTEEVEPGVFRVLGDETHDLRSVDHVVVTPQGDVFVLSNEVDPASEDTEYGPAYDSRVIRVGQTEPVLVIRDVNELELHPAADGAPVLVHLQMALGPDGSVLEIAHPDTSSSVFRHGRWAPHPEDVPWWLEADHGPCDERDVPAAGRFAVGGDCWIDDWLQGDLGVDAHGNGWKVSGGALYVITPAAFAAAPDRAVAVASTGPELVPDVDLVTEEVEPGVYRVLSDGVRDLSAIGRVRYEGHSLRGHDTPLGLAIGPDGDAWVYASRSSTSQELIRLGDPDSFPLPSTDGWLEPRVGPDGTLWTRATEGNDLRRLDDDGWSHVTGPDGIWPHAWGFSPEGAVWTIGSDDGRRPRMARYDAGGWQEHPVDIGPDIRQLLEDHDYPVGASLRPTLEWGASGVSGDGDVWAGVSLAFDNVGNSRPVALMRYDGERWSLVDPLGVGTYQTIIPSPIGADGTWWLYLETGPADVDGDPDQALLARFKDRAWSVYPTADGFVPHTELEGAVVLRVDDSGTVWVRAMTFPTDGVRSFDGTTWRTYLNGLTVDDMEVGPDGNVWVLAADHLYVITPEAVAAAG